MVARHSVAPIHRFTLLGAMMLLTLTADPNKRHAQTEPDHLFLFALFWHQSDVGPDLFAFLADQIQIAVFNSDPILDIGFHTDLSQRIGYFEFLQPRYLIEADIGDRVGDVDFGNFPVPGR